MKRGRGSPNYGTHRAILPPGYVRVWQPEHPLANRDGYVLEHRKVLHDAGVPVRRGMHVHHLNGDKADNRIENLAVVTASDHSRGHIAERGTITNQFGVHPLRGQRPCERCGTLFAPWTNRGRFCTRSCANRRGVHAVVTA